MLSDMFSVNIELLFAWILFFANECFVQNPKRYDYQFIDLNSYSRRENTRNNRIDNVWMAKNKHVMTCNCSWGTVPWGFNISVMPVKYKIVGGTPVDKKENYPMMAGLRWKLGDCIFCGATILTEFHALTAAHCLYGESSEDIFLVVGTRFRCKGNNNEGQYIPLQEPPYVHEYYDEENNHQDIAIVVTQHKIIFSNKVGPACIYTQPIRSLDEPVFVLGWGKIAETGEPSMELIKVFLKNINIEECKRHTLPGLIGDNLNAQMCTYSLNKDTCGGDSGGPLFVLDHSVNRLAQIALVSMGVGCGRRGEPGINTALYSYLGWMQWTIETTMRLHHPQEYRKCGQSFCYSTLE